MLIVLLIIGAIILAAGIFIYAKWGQKLYYDYDWIYFLLNAIGGIVLGISLIATIVVGIKYSGHMTIDEKIEIYKQENANIENQMSIVVSEYMGFETETLEKFKNESLTTLVSLYPELKSDTLVTKQLELYVENNKVIKSLECERLKYRVYAWWLFFGG